MDKLTIEQFGATVKAKYPQYASFSDKEIGEKTLAKHPEYANRIKTEEVKKTGTLSRVKGSLTDSLSQARQQIAGTGEYADQIAPQRGVELAATITGAPIKAAGELPVVKPIFGAISKAYTGVTDWLGDKLGNTKVAQEFVTKYPEATKTLENIAKTTGAISEVAGNLTIAEGGIRGGKNIKTKVPEIKIPEVKLPESIKTISKDIIPTKGRIVNTEVTKALDLTQGDVKNIALSTGNDVGEFLSSKNLIGTTVKETTDKLNNFSKSNYDAVRGEISKVKSLYPANTVPRYKEALTSIKQQIKDTPGLQKTNLEVDTLLKKKNLTLGDIQRTKELMDEHFSLYKATGDVKEGVAKSGLTNIRTDLKTFIEKQVELKTGADIRALNNNVSTSRSILDAIETRSTRGLTRANISTSDIVTFLTGSAVGSPVFGLVSVLAKKLYESPTLKLKFSKWLDGLNDAKRLEIQTNLEKGILPKEIKIQSSKAPSIQLKK